MLGFCKSPIFQTADGKVDLSVNKYGAIKKLPMVFGSLTAGLEGVQESNRGSSFLLTLRLFLAIKEIEFNCFCSSLECKNLNSFELGEDRKSVV